MSDKEEILKDEIIDIGKRLYAMRLVAGTSGNLSARIDRTNILITKTGTALGNLQPDDIIRVDISTTPKASLNINPERSRRIDLSDEQDLKNKHLTTEFPLHSLVYKNFPHQVIIHCHPVLINAYFAVYADIKALTFETKLYLGDVPVVEQDTPAVTKPELVIEALKLSNLAVLKNHGVVSIGDNFKDALYLIEALEEAVKTACVARLFKKEILDDLDKELKVDLVGEKTYEMFCREHIQAIVDLVNKDEFIARKGEELDLTLKLCVKLDRTDKVYKFNFEKGKIKRLDFDEDAPFIISACQEVWELVFLGKLDPFVAVTQGRMKLQGQLGELSRWYVPFTRLFELFKQVKIK